MKKTIDKVNQFDERDHDTLELIHRVTHQYRSSLLQDTGEAARDITHMDGKVLLYFGRNPGATLSDLAQHSGRDRAQLTRLIKGLRERGLLEGTADPDDRRNTRLTLTGDGLAVTSTLKTQGRQAAKRALEGFSEDEKQTLLQLLQRVSDNFKSS
ncbi:MarR family winged helix-turn-helix transcriptional regulator [Pseudoduganella namucuonensis]|uniref:DNA-binding transcriptional regulator, MarR family n=1 Tax=Pseudoduganella namucuonensis TaxID=1035707 RepID=A0A1I7L6X9_9BURK|nr:MarR family transcriptional regulator [Pseudoduganella namucuonensis]SFV05489.1 DNA-binding transcriptional regulator, MarR family [Pseudoduganella namucuonensis]